MRRRAWSSGQLSRRSLAAKAVAQRQQKALVASEAQVEQLRKAQKSERGALKAAQVGRMRP